MVQMVGTVDTVVVHLIQLSCIAQSPLLLGSRTGKVEFWEACNAVAKIGTDLIVQIDMVGLSFHTLHSAQSTLHSAQSKQAAQASSAASAHKLGGSQLPACGCMQGGEWTPKIHLSLACKICALHCSLVCKFATVFAKPPGLFHAYMCLHAASCATSCEVRVHQTP